MATHSSTLAWKIPWTEEPGRLQSMGSPLSSQKSKPSCLTALYQALLETSSQPTWLQKQVLLDT